MSTNTHPRSEKRPIDDDDRVQRKSDLAKELKHTKFGIWDVYEQIPTGKFGINIPGVSILPRNLEFVRDLPFVWRMVKDVIKIKSCWYYLSLFIAVKVLASLEPAVALWFTGHYLTIVQVAIDERRLDEQLLIFASVGRLCCFIVRALLQCLEQKLQVPLDQLMEEHFERNVFGVRAHLDLPTHKDKVMRGKLDATLKGPLRFPHGHYSVAWQPLSVTLGLLSVLVCLVAELSVLVKVVGGQQGGLSFAVMHFGRELLGFLIRPDWLFSLTNAFIAITNNEHYVKLHGLKQLVSDHNYRQEIVAGNLAEFLKDAYNRAYAHVSGKCASYDETMIQTEIGGAQQLMSVLLPDSIGELAEAAYLLKSAARPETIPACFMTIRLVQMATEHFVSAFWTISQQTNLIGDRFHKVRQLYEIHEIQNKVLDGTVSFPEDSRSLTSGIAVEFRNVSFRYPGSEIFALRDVSFKIEKGQLCVIVGASGSGKSTMLKLILRLYDPTEGTILVNGQDIKTFKLADLRESMAVLFQDYTHFPLTVRDNIGFGDSRNAHDEARVREAARLAGAEEFINKLPEGFDTYLDRPVKDFWNIPSNAKTRSGRKVDYDLVREVIGGAGNKEPIKLSGGQMQRLAVSRMFMRAVVSEEERLGLLVFDEPSAALDPTAEHDLFTRIRKLRGGKTVVFSSHRFGELTKPADLILCMDDSTVLESGVHNELMAKGGRYAELWNLQAQAFL